MPKKGYSEKSFKGTYSQEQDLILMMEERFELIRNKVMHLKKVTFYSKLASKNDLSELL